MAERVLIGKKPAADAGRSGKAAPKWWTLSAYGSMALPLALAEIPILLYLPVFYAQELALSASLVGLVFLLARFWDGLVDLSVGWLSDKPYSPLGRRKPWVLFGAPFLIISTWFLCNPPDGAGLVYLCVWAALFYTAFTAVKIPHISWGTEISDDYVERSRVMTFREAFSFLGNLLFALMPLLFLKDDAPLSEVLFLISLSVLLSVPIATSLIAVFVKDPLPTQMSRPELLKGFSEVLRNPVMVRFCLAILCLWTLIGASNSVAVFAFQVGLKLPQGLFYVVFVLYVTTLCMMPVVGYLSKRVDKHHLMMGSLALHGIAMLAHLFVPQGQAAAVYPLWVLAGIATGPLVIVPPSMLADIVDHGELASGERRPGAYVAIFNLIMKIGLALGVGFSFGLLDIFSFKPNAASFTEADAWNIKLIGFALPAILSVPAILILLKYPLNRQRHHDLRAALAARGGS